MSLPLKVNEILTDVINLLKPSVVFKDIFKFYQKQIVFKDGSFDIKGELHLFALGKAASFELKAFKDLYEKETGVKVRSAVAYTKKDHLCDDDEIYQMAGTHPVISSENLDLSTVFIDLISEIPEGDTLIFLLSGGGSALLEMPVEGMSFEQMRKRHQELLSSGLNINEINEKRKEISQIKGGGLLRFIKTTNILQLITCDIPNEDIFDVSSGPLLNRSLEEHPKTILTQSASSLLNKISASRNYIVKGVYDDRIENELLQISEDLPAKGDTYISGGELTVALPENCTGLGGRSTHFVLALAKIIYAEEKNKDVHILSFGTDGTDGPTDAAGAYINYNIFKENEDRAQMFLENNDSYHFFDEVGGLIKTGPTKNNLMDVRFIWRDD